MLKFLQNRLMLIMTSTFIFSLLLASPLAAAEPKLPENLPEVSQAQFKTQIIQHGNLIAHFKPLYTTVDDPANHETKNIDYDSVAKLILTLDTKPRPVTVGCSGALISDTHILTAAHCVTSDKNGKLILRAGSAIFNGVSFTIDASQTVVHPDWSYSLSEGNDVAILKLKENTDLPFYALDSDGNDDLTVGYKVGYGRSGTGDVGDVLGWGTMRDGKNLYDAVADTMLDELGEQGYVPGSVLQYDFDNNKSENDAFGLFFGLADKGLLENEVNSAPGDSGGPTFNADGEITGITSYGLRLAYVSGLTSDVDGKVNSTFGEFSGDTRVSTYYSFIDSVIKGESIPPPIDEGPDCPPAKAARGKC